MLNEKMVELGKKSSIIREIFEYAKKRKAEIGDNKVFDFSIGNPSIPAPEKFTNTLKRLITEVDPVNLHGYTSAAGDMGTRQAIAEHIVKCFGAEANAENIYMTCGAAASLTITLNSVVVSGDEVVTFAPFFPEYKVFVEKAGANLKVVKCRAGDFQVDFDTFEKAVTPATKAVIVNSPNNPTGVVFSADTIEKLAEFLSEKEKEYGHEIYIIADEPYRELVYGGVEVPYIPNYYNNTVVCYSYSKSLSVPGERIGYIFVSPKCTVAGDLFAAVCGAGRSLGYVCAPSLLQYAIRECVDETSDISAYDKNRTMLYEALTEMGYEAAKPDGAFYMFVKAPSGDANEFYETAKKYELLLVPSDSFGYPGYVRIAYCISPEVIKNALPAFAELIKEYK